MAEEKEKDWSWRTLVVGYGDDDDDNEKINGRSHHQYRVNHCLCLLGVNSGASLASSQLYIGKPV